MVAAGLAQVGIWWEYIGFYRLWFELPMLAGLAVLLSHLVKRRQLAPLSVMVEKEFKEYERKLSRRRPVPERLSSLRYVVAITAFPFLSSCVVGLLGVWCVGFENEPRMEYFSSTLHTCGTIVATFTAIVITVTTFAVTINSGYIRRTSSLFGFYLATLGFRPLASFAVGFGVSNVYGTPVK
jgi:hypothetical protein